MIYWWSQVGAVRCQQMSSDQRRSGASTHYFGSEIGQRSSTAVESVPFQRFPGQ